MELISITNAEYIGDYKLHLVFDDGTSKSVNLEQYLDKPIFKPLINKDYFKSFKLNSFTIEWSNGADFAPEFLYSISK
jgi:hypothetical protein